MPYFSKRSEEKLKTCHNDLQLICREAIKVMDFSVLCGYRTGYEQDKLFHEKKSLVMFPKSKHNKSPSKAVDICPYPIDFDNIPKFYELKGVMFAIVHYLKENGKITHSLEWGGMWRSLKDYPHFQLKEE